jgi:hypothetical protein
MKSNDDNLYASTVLQALKLGWGRKQQQAPSFKQAPKRKQNLKRVAPKQNMWALTGPDELR